MKVIIGVSVVALVLVVLLFTPFGYSILRGLGIVN
jgi:hypothetical protein